MAGFELQTVTEAAADVPTAAIFADIRDTMGVALVNLIWRHLAISPAALHWSWHSLKPIYESGMVPQAAWSLRQSLVIANLSPLSASERAMLTESVSDLRLVDAVLRTYERGNAQNLVALCALHSRLEADMQGRRLEPGRPASTPGDAERAAERADRVTERLPPLPSMAELSAPVRADIEALAQAWIPQQHHGVIPSAFRHLAHWPELLSLYRDKLQTMPATPAPLAQLADDAVAQANASAAPLAAHLGQPAPVDKATQQWLADALALFIGAVIGRGVVLVPAMRKLLA